MLDKETRLSKAHDIAETLQYCLEGKLALLSQDSLLLTDVVGLTEVDRAFVTVDCKVPLHPYPFAAPILIPMLDTSQGPTGHVEA